MNNSGVTVLISTYNWPLALELTLNSLVNQSILPNEIIIADDGSSSDTEKLIQKYKNKVNIPIIHCWQEDKGFRLSLIRNKGLLKCNFDYIVQIDGDIICHKKFIEDHLFYRKKGFFLSGKRCNLSEEDTINTLQTKTLVLSKSTLNNNKIQFKKRLGIIFKILRPNFVNKLVKTPIRGCNMSYWLQDAKSINGYNENIVGWGKEDDEFSLRLNKYGVKRKSLKFGAIAYHLKHEMRDLKNLERNEFLFKQSIKSDDFKAKNSVIGK
ncbi:glycosyltransferase family 2 protein [Aquimarina agarivorans]|uniref:glycosyltransferase family 2 protein n=1 Tax=Aquimarina agarivorans TaxID=980584 RepID=UPI000248FC72|nr:glycosyltransferase family 2 protein [Aquimarina agarivorans]